MRHAGLARFEKQFRVRVPAEIHAFVLRPPEFAHWRPYSSKRLASPETHPTCLGFFPLMSNTAGDEMGLWYPPGKSRPLVVQRGHEEDVLFLIEEDPRRFVSSPLKYLKESDWFASAPPRRQRHWKAWSFDRRSGSAEDLLKPFYVAANRHLLDRERKCAHDREFFPEESKGCALEMILDRVRERGGEDKRSAAFRQLLDEPSMVKDWSRWFHLGRRFMVLRDWGRAASALVNAMTQTFWENYPLILPDLQTCVLKLRWDPAREQIRRWIPYVRDSVAWRPDQGIR